MGQNITGPLHPGRADSSLIFLGALGLYPLCWLDGRIRCPTSVSCLISKRVELRIMFLRRVRIFIGALVINMRQWITAIEGKMVGTVIETFLAFFICVWLVPIIFSLCLDLSSERSGSFDSDLAWISKTGIQLERQFRKDFIDSKIDAVTTTANSKVNST